MFEGREYLISDAKYLKISLQVPYKEMHREAQSLRDRYVPYKKDAKWYSLPIVGISSEHPYSWEVYNYKDARAAAPYMQWTEIAEQCPVTVNWLQTVYPSSSYARVRFMLLEAGGEIPFHRDTTHSVLGAVNVALNNPKNCLWKWSDGDSLQFEPGDVRLMNISYEHSVQNSSNEDRYHLIIHHYDSTVEWKSLVKAAMKENNVQGDFCYSTELF